MPKVHSGGQVVMSKRFQTLKTTPGGVQLGCIVSANVPIPQIHSCSGIQLNMTQAIGFWCLNAALAIHTEALCDPGAR